ncbi:hypothetical protein P692DRAFT_201268717 [Suillus brevipes Sb2]|nr:hypothetical protein P692DRAFT_201268717 [Suillus brevipes Sb2]
MQVLFKPTASSDSLTERSELSAPASDELPDGTEFPSETVDSRDAATSPSPSLPPQGHPNHDIPSPVHISPPVELTDGFQVTLEVINSRDAAASPPPLLLPEGSSHPQVATASTSTLSLSSPPKSFWKRFPVLNRSTASGDSKRWNFPRMGSIMRRKHRNAEPQAGPNIAQ